MEELHLKLPPLLDVHDLRCLSVWEGDSELGAAFLRFPTRVPKIGWARIQDCDNHLWYVQQLCMCAFFAVYHLLLRWKSYSGRGVLSMYYAWNCLKWKLMIYYQWTVLSPPSGFTYTRIVHKVWEQPFSETFEKSTTTGHIVTHPKCVSYNSLETHYFQNLLLFCHQDERGSGCWHCHE